MLHQRVVVDDFGADEAAFHVGMDGSGGFLGAGVPADEPGARFGVAGGVEDSAVHEGEDGLHHPFGGAGLDAQVGTESGGVLFGQLGDLLFDAGGDDGQAGLRTGG